MGSVILVGHLMWELTIGAGRDNGGDVTLEVMVARKWRWVHASGRTERSRLVWSLLEGVSGIDEFLTQK